MMKKLLLIVLAVLLLAVPAIAGNIETDRFYEKNTSASITGVDMLVYTCKDSECRSVAEPAKIIKNSGSSNYITAEFPGTKNPADYAEYFYAPGYLPMEYVIPNDYGTGGVYEYSVYFEKANECHAPIYEFNVVNTAYENEPLAISVLAKLDAKTYSAFRDSGVPPYFVPSAYKDNYYSALTDISLKIKDLSGTTVFEAKSTKNIYMDTEANVEFFWTPANTGQYAVEVSTKVIDDQCSSNTEQKTAQQVTVLASRPTNEAYVILNNLTANNPYPQINDEITFTYNKISNYADADHAKTAVPMTATYTVKEGKSDSNQNIVFNRTETIPATGTELPSAQSFSWTPNDEGWYTVYVNGKCTGSLANGVTNHDETIWLEFYVEPQTENEVIFTVTELNSNPLNPVDGALVEMTSKSEQTSSQGIATIDSVAPGTYTYTISHADYKSYTGRVQVGIVTAYVDVQLEKMTNGTNGTNETNNAPVFTSTPVTKATKGVKYTYDSDASDSDSGDSITYSLASGPAGMAVSASNGVVTWTPSNNGEFDVSVKAEDSHGAYAVQSYKIKVSSKGDDTAEEFRIEDLVIAKMRLANGEYFKPGEQIVLSVSLGNAGNSKLEDIQVTASVQELGERASTGHFDLKKKDNCQKALFLEIPEHAGAGNYPLRIEIYNGDVKRIVYRDFFIE